MSDAVFSKIGSHRRGFLRAAIGGIIGVSASPVMAVAGSGNSTGHRSLSFQHLHTGERVSAPYWESGRYNKDALAAIDHLLRDFRTGDQTRMDVDLLEFLHRLRVKLDTDQPFQIISGYRSPRTNARLAAKSRGVAKRSYHMLGMAIDIRVPGRQLRQVRRAALDLRLGGVGYYNRSRFVHLDTGRVRFW